MTTPKLPRTPCPPKDQENAGNEGSPLNETYLPSALKLTTPFWKGTRREHPTTVVDASGISFLPSARNCEEVSATPFTTAGSVCFPDELPLELFANDVPSPASKHKCDDEGMEESMPAPPSPAWTDPDVSLVTANPESDDFSAMIDAMAHNFREEIEAERVVLELISSGRTTIDPAEKEKTRNPISDALQKELQSERENRKSILTAFAEERRDLHSQLEEVQSNADLSIRLAREEAQRRIQEERALLQMTREEWAVEQDHAIADASRQATNLLQESRMRQNAMRNMVNTLQSEHSEEVKVAIERVRKEAQENTKANLSIQKAATTHMFQRELFDMETELLETLDELDTIQSASEVEKKELENRVIRLKLAVEVERAVKERSVGAIQEQLQEALRLNRHLDNVVKEDQQSMQQLERIQQLEAALEYAKTERETAQQEQVSENQRRDVELDVQTDTLATGTVEHDKTRQLLIHTQGELRRFENLAQSRGETLDELRGEVKKLERELQDSVKSHESQVHNLRESISHLEEQLNLQTMINEQLCQEHISKMVDLFQELRCVHKEELETVRNHLGEEHRLSLHSHEMLSREASMFETVDFYRRIATALGKNQPEAKPTNTIKETSTFVSIATFETGSTKVGQELEDSVAGSQFVALDQWPAQGKHESSTEKQSTFHRAASGRDNPTATTLSLFSAAHFNPPDTTENPEEDRNENIVREVSCANGEDDHIHLKHAESKFLPSPNSAFRKTTASHEIVLGAVDPPPLVATVVTGSLSLHIKEPPPIVTLEKELATKQNIKFSQPLAKQNDKLDLSAPSTPPYKVARSRTIPRSTVQSSKKIIPPSSKRIPTAPNSSHNRVARESRIRPITMNNDNVRANPRVKPPVPRLSKLSKTPAASLVSRNRIPSASNSTASKQRSVLKKPSTSKISASSKPRFLEETSSSVRRVATISGLPPRKSSQTTEGKSIPPRRPRPSVIAECGRTTRDQRSARKPPPTSSIPRSLQKSADSRQRTRISVKLPPGEKRSKEESTGTRTQTEKVINSMSPTKSDESLEHFQTPRTKQDARLQTPCVGTVGDASRAPSSQFVEDKFRSLCDVWSTSKTPRSERKPQREELPSSLKLDLRLAPVVTRVDTPKVGTASRVRDLGNSGGDAGRRALEKQCYSSPITTPGFLLDDISSPEELLVSPISEPVDKQVRLDEKKIRLAAVRIQSFVRSSLAAKIYQVEKRYRATLRTCATAIQKFARRFLAQRRFQELMASVRRAQQDVAVLLVQTGALLIQKTWRCHYEKSRFKSMKHGFCFFQETAKRIQLRHQTTVHAAEVIQTCWRSFSARSKLHGARSIIFHDQLRTSSAIVIQKTWRIICCYNGFCRKKEAALQLRSLMRHRTAKTILCELKRIQEKKNSAATVISSFFLGVVARKRVQRRRKDVAASLSTGAIALQSLWRQRRDWSSYGALQKGIVRLQAIVRTRQCSKRYATLYHGLVQFQLVLRKRSSQRRVTRAMKAACSIQKAWRRANALHEYQHRWVKTVTLQSLVRGHLVRKALRTECLAAARIQTIWRRFRSARNLKTVEVGFTKLQCLFRTIRDARNFETKRSAAVRLQARFRTHLHRRKWFCIKKALVSLQCHIRGRICRQKKASMQIAVCTRNEAERQAVICIQRVWRMRRAAISFKTAKLGFIKLQSRARRLISAHNSKAVLSAVLLIQRGWRALIDDRVKYMAAVILQRVWRMIKSMTYLKSHVLAAVTIQSTFRTRLEQRRLSTTRMYVIQVQSAWRSYRATGEYNLRKTAIIRLQSFQRTRAARARFHEMQRSVQTIQTVFMGALWRVKHCRKRRGVITIQSWWRKVTFRVQYGHKLRSLIKMQRASKRYLAAKADKKLCAVLFDSPRGSLDPHSSVHSPKRPALGTIAISKERKALGNISTSKARKPLGDISKGKVRKPLGEVSTIFSPVKTRIRKRGLTGPENSHNLLHTSVGTKRQKSELKKAPEVAFPQPDQMKVVELREALQFLGVKPKDFRKLRKAQLIEMITELQKDGGEGTNTTVVA